MPWVVRSTGGETERGAVAVSDKGMREAQKKSSWLERIACDKTHPAGAWVSYSPGRVLGEFDMHKWRHATRNKKTSHYVAHMTVASSLSAK